MMLMRRLRPRRIENLTTGSRRNARMAATAMGVRTGCKKDIALTTSAPMRSMENPMARKEREVMAVQRDFV
jgi:hypothetical protein